MGTTTAFVGASLGGSIRPLSSECVMIMAPTKRVVTPQLVLPHVIELPLFVLELHVESFAEILAEIVAGAGLQPQPVLHHGFSIE